MLHYTRDHEWVSIEGDIATAGISNHAQAALGDVVYIDLPVIGRVLEVGGDAAVVESVKAASDVYAPLAGTVTAVNPELAGDPGMINRDPESDGWFFKLRIDPATDLSGLMDAEAYQAFVATL